MTHETIKLSCKYPIGKIKITILYNKNQRVGSKMKKNNNKNSTAALPDLLFQARF